MFDWVNFSQFIGKFKKSESDAETVRKFKEETLSERQQRQINTNLTTAEQHKGLQLSEEIGYNTGDYVFVKKINRFAQIESLLVMQSNKWADLTIFNPHQVDNETGIMYADDDLPDVYEMHALNDLSKALVTCEIYGVRWFVSYYEEQEIAFDWLNEHIVL